MPLHAEMGWQGSREHRNGMQACRAILDGLKAAPPAAWERRVEKTAYTLFRGRMGGKWGAKWTDESGSLRFTDFYDTMQEAEASAISLLGLTPQVAPQVATVQVELEYDEEAMFTRLRAHGWEGPLRYKAAK